MQQDRASFMAFRVVLSRAAHQVHDEPRIFDDPMALEIVGERWAAAIRADQSCSRTPHSFAGRTDGFRVTNFAHLMTASR